MKTKTVVFSLILTFTSCALFAQSQQDTTKPKSDTLSHKDTTTAILGIKANSNLRSILKDNSNDKNLAKSETVYAIFPAKENGEAINSKK